MEDVIKPETSIDEISAVIGVRCPWMNDGRCHVNCMLFVTAADADTVLGSVIEGEGHCSLAIMASHIASEKHAGGNYLVKTVGYTDPFSIDDSNV